MNMSERWGEDDYAHPEVIPPGWLIVLAYLPILAVVSVGVALYVLDGVRALCRWSIGRWRARTRPR